MKRTTVRKVIIVPATAATLFAFGMIAPIAISAATNNVQLTTAIQQLKSARNQRFKKLLQNSKVLQYLNLTPEDLINLKKQNKTIKDYALENGYSLDGLKQVMEQEFTDRVNERFSEGKISLDRKTYLLSHMNEKISYWLNNEKSMFRWMGR